MISKLTHEVLRLMPPEFAHALGKAAMSCSLGAPGRLQLSAKSPRLLGRQLRNLLGLAAGFDKNGELIHTFQKYGFGFMEVGSVTLRGGPGNEKPRLFRLPRRHLMNRMGLNGDPAHEVVERLQEVPRGPYLVNVAKTHDPDVMGDAAIADVLETFRMVRHYGFGTVINLSCPNTKEGRTFQDSGAARELLQEVSSAHQHDVVAHSVPWGVKIGPDLGDDLQPLIEVCEDLGCGFYVACNTAPYTHPKYGKGGLSGPDVAAAVNFTIVRMRSIVPMNQTIIACGGLSSGADARRFQISGADAFEAYTGFVVGANGGPDFAHKILAQWESLQ